MNINFRNLPAGSLPYNTIQSCKQMMLRLFEDIPFLPELPEVDSNDTLFNRTFYNIPCIAIKDGKILLPDSNNDRLNLELMHMDRIYSAPDLNGLNRYSSETPFLELYFEILKRIKPNYTVINLFGPFSFANSVFNKNASTLLTDRTYRKFIVQSITLKALWFVHKVKEASPSTKPIIMFEENMLYKFGTLKRTNDSITKETVTTLFEKVFQPVKKAGGVIGVQSFEKCNWQLVFDTECVDMISFDAYNNPSSLNIIASSVNKFLAQGGCINWGIVPVMNENVIRTLNTDGTYSRFASTLEALAAEGVSMDLLYRKSTISVQGNLGKYPILFAEKAIITASQASKKIPSSSAQ